MWSNVGQVIRAGLCVMIAVGLLVGLTACGKPVSEPIEPPARSVPVSTAAAEQLLGRMETLSSRQGPVTFTITEEELTSYLAVYGFGDILQEPAIWLDDGVIQASARLCVARGYKLHAIIALQSHHGVPQIRVRQVVLNGRRLPRLLLLGVEDAVNDALADLSSPLALSDVAITEGLMVVTGEMSY
ncbi:MAG: hypothetical protein GX552_05680 [Chloroflexi bacterium]|jgi:hypothetical protein|nr:hypothetical protein [Chloroflexota bacterium]